MSSLADPLAVLTILVVLIQTALSLRAQPEAWGAFKRMWRTEPWARQVFLDFYGLEIVLWLWMFTHAAQTGEWLPALVCAVFMPVFGSMAAAAYWLWAV